MKIYKWRDNPEVLAKLVDANSLRTVRTQNLVLKPNESCAIIVDGRIGDVLTEGIVANIGGGFGRYVGDLLGITATDRRLLFANTGPVDLPLTIDARCKDGSIVPCLLNL